MAFPNIFTAAKLPYSGIIIAIAIVLTTWVSHQINFFQITDAALYGLTMRYSLVKPAPPSVLLIAADPRDRGASEQSWLRVLETLEKLGARQILFTFLPENTSPRFFERANTMGTVIFGRGIVADPAGDPDQARLEPWPAAVNTLDREPPFGVVALPPADNGYYHRQYAGFTVQGQHHPALEVRAAAQSAGDPSLLPDQPYWVNFQGGPAYLPTVGLQRLLRDGLIPELVRGRSVLIGVLPPPQTPSLHTPLDQTANSGMSLLAFQGYALETLLRNQPIQPFSALMVLTILAVVVFASMIIYQWGRLRFRLWVTSGILLIHAALVWLSLAYAHWWLPATALIVAQIATFTLVFWHRSLAEDKVLRSLIVNLSSRLREHATPPGFYASPEPWKQVVDLVRQTLDLSWLIFLERIPDQYYLREIAAMNCQFADIDERRRDYRRSPYSDALVERRALRLTRRLFLKADPTIDQYLTPLLFGSELLGFWAMGVSPDKIAANPDFFTLVDDFRHQITELLYHRLQWQQRQTAEARNETLRYLRLEGGESLHHTLRQTMLAFERRLFGLEQVFQGMETAAIFYNPFGRALQTNKAMTVILRRGQLPAYEMTALDLLSALCGTSLSDGRQALQRVFTAHQTVTLPASVPGDTQHRYTLRARPILVADNAQPPQSPSEAVEALPFQLRGILIELIDVTTLHNLSLLKSELKERVHQQLRNHLQTMVLAVALREGQGGEGSREPGRAILRQQVETAVALLNQAQKYLLTDLAALQQFDRYPVEPRTLLRAALTRLARQADERRVRIAVQMPEILSLVMADPDALEEILETLVTVLIEDAVVGSELTVKLREQVGWLVYDFTNQGFGMPDAKLQRWLSGNDSEATPLFRRLRLARRQVTDWKGLLQGSSALGQGMRFMLRLPCFSGEEQSDGSEDTIRSHALLGRPDAQRILVVDDSKMIRRLVTLSLQKGGYHARAAANGQQAITLLENWMPDLIVLDMMMPVMDGLKFLEWRNQHHPHLPVLALTGMERPEAREQILAAGANAVLFKPMHIPELLAKVELLLGAGEAVAPTPPH